MHSFSRNLRQRATVTLIGLALFALASLVFSGMTGSVSIPLSDIPAAVNELLHGQSTTLASTLVELRVSRATTAFVTGASLSLAGVMIALIFFFIVGLGFVLGAQLNAALATIPKTGQKDAVTATAEA